MSQVNNELTETTVFDDFPGYTDWFVGEKALAWRKRHEAEILDIYSKLGAVKEVIPDLIIALQVLDDLSPPISEYRVRRREIIELLENIQEEEESG